MSVVPMKLVTIAGPLQEFDSVISSCIINEQFHPESTTHIMKNIKYLYPFDQQNPYVELLNRAELLADQAGIPLAYRNFESIDIESDTAAEYFDEFERKYRALLDEQDALKARVVENGQIVLQLEHLLDVNVPLQEFFTVTYVKFRFGRMPRESYNNFIQHLRDRPDVFFFVTNAESEWVYGMYMTPRLLMEKVDSLFATLQFERIRISGRVKGTGEQAIREIHEETERAEFRLEEIKSQLKLLISEETDNFLSHYSYIRFKNDSYNIRRYAAHTEETFYVLGWVPEPDYEAFTQKLSAHENLSLVLVSDDPERAESFTPPIKLKNPKIFRPFEPYVKMYGLPTYNEIDPTPLMSITYPLLFGIMFGDVGQGVLLILAGLLMWKLKRMWLGRIICYAGLSSIGFGFVYGSVFGFEHWLDGFKILENSANTQTALMLSIYLGMFLLCLSMVFNVINGIRQKNYEKILFGPNSVFGMVLYLAIIIAVLPLLGFGESILPTGVALAIAAVPIVLVFLRSPLSHMVARRKRKREGSTSNFILENFFELIEILLSYITNTISFLRVGAYAISHASMMYVVFTLSQMANGSQNLVVIIIGNIIVMGIEGLLVGIQCLRLEFYEVFGRFYSGGGRPYSPIIIDYKSRNE